MMRSFLPAFFLLGSVCAYSWQTDTAPELVPITDDTVIAKVNGRDFTAGELERILQDVRPNLRKAAGVDPQKFLEDYAHGLLLKEEAEKAGLDRAKPYRGKIEAAVRQILVDAMIAEKSGEIRINPEDVRQAYQQNPADWQQAKVKVIFVAGAGYVQDLATGSQRKISPEEAKLKIEKAAHLVREGEDFVAVAKEYSDDSSTSQKGADFPFPVRANSTSVPPDMKSAILEAKAGDIVGPLQHATGHYLFRVESAEVADFDSVREEIESGMRKAAVQKWLRETRGKVSVSLVHKPFWNTYVAGNRAILEAEEKAAAAAVGEQK